MPVEDASRYQPSLDGWRAVAILMVLFAHGSTLARSFPVEFGSSGVTFFMILSGYLITTRLLTTYCDESGIKFRKFYIQRAFRILPPIVAYLAFLCALTWFSRNIQLSRSEIVAALLFSRNYVVVPGTGHFSGWFTGHFWSLSVEEHFYLLWPIVLYLAGKRRGLYVAMLGVAGCALWRWTGWNYRLHINDVIPHVPYFFRTDTRVDALLLGSAAAIVLARANWRAAICRFVSARDTITCVVLLGLIWSHAGHWFIGLPEELIVTALLTITVLYPTAALARLLAWRPLRAIGKLSYSLYIWQELFLTPAKAGWWTIFPLNFLLLSAAALASYFFIEKPARQYGAQVARRFASRNSGEQEQPAVPAVGVAY